jgi:hypothetical protein
VITPAGSEKSSHGNLEATAISAISIGDRVTAEASHGYATIVMPSPKFETSAELKSRWYFEPSFSVDAVLKTSPFIDCCGNTLTEVEIYRFEQLEFGYN